MEDFDTRDVENLHAVIAESNNDSNRFASHERVGVIRRTDLSGKCVDRAAR